MALLSAAEEAPWYVLLVRPRSEKRVADQLKKSGISVCVPIQRQWRQWSDRRKLVEVVLFSQYVFVSTNEQQRNQVFQDGNVFKYLRTNGRLATLTTDEARMIRQLGGLEAPVEITYSGFRVGEQVEVKTGPLAGCRGKVAAVNGGSRLQLELPSLQCFAQVEVKGEEVRKMDVSFAMTAKIDSE
jgi:transcriptional antiterminator RfaH